MEGALAFISWIAEWIGKFIPRWEILPTTWGAVKWVRGSKIKKLGPGIHWYWPLTTVFKKYPICFQAETLRSQVIVTVDDKSVCVAGVILYEVADVEALLTNTYEAQTAVHDLGLIAIHDVCCKLSWEELKQGQRRGTLDTRLRNEAKTALTPFGVTVIKLQLTDLAPARVLKLHQSTAKDES